MTRLSVLTIANGHGGTLSRVCGICKRTFRLPIQDLVLVRPPGVPIEWKIDVGGYCASCGDYRCEEHIAARDGIDHEPGSPDLPIVELFCRQCGERVGSAP
jgi:hypothetical protein